MRFDFGTDNEFFPSYQESILNSEPNATLYSTGIVRSAGTRRPRREADRSPPSTADVKNRWSYTSIYLHPPYHFTLCTVTT